MAAAELIVRQGFSRTRLEEILRASEVQKGNFYYYFRSKDELGLAVLKEIFVPKAEEWLAALIGKSGKQLTTFTPALLEALEDEADHLLPVLRLALDLSSAGPELSTEAGAVLVQLGQGFDAALEHPALQSSGLCFLSCLSGAMLSYTLLHDPGPLRTSLEAALLGLRPCNTGEPNDEPLPV